MNASDSATNNKQPATKKPQKTSRAKKTNTTPFDRVTKKQAAKQSDNIYAESVVWQCCNLKSGLTSNINGVLAQVLKKYPDDYQLMLLDPQPKASKKQGV